MTDADPDPANPDWMSPCVVVPKHIPGVLKAFGPREPPARRRIVGKLDDMAINYWFASKHEPPVAFTAASDQLDRIATSIVNTLSLWKQLAPLHPAIFMAQFLRLPAKERKNYDHIAWEALDPVAPLTNVLPLIKALRDQDIYRAAFSQPPTADSHKHLTRALLWEPLLHLMNDFGQLDFAEHQPLIDTIRSLHLALGIEPPDGRAVRQTVSAWRKREAR
jgi:hypothetical protein